MRVTLTDLRGPHLEFSSPYECITLKADKLEDFLYINFPFRTILLELTVLGVLVGTWYMQASEVFTSEDSSGEEEDLTDSTATTSGEDSEEEDDSEVQIIFRNLILVASWNLIFISLLWVEFTLTPKFLAGLGWVLGDVAGAGVLSSLDHGLPHWIGDAPGNLYPLPHQ